MGLPDLRPAEPCCRFFFNGRQRSRRADATNRHATPDDVGNDDTAAAAAAGQFKVLGHPMRHRLLAALAEGGATISQLAVTLDSSKGNVAYHLRVLADADLVEPAGTRQVRGGTEQYYRRAMSGPYVSDAAAAGIEPGDLAAADPGGLLVLRTVRLTAGNAERLTAVLRDLASQPDDGDGQPYSLLLGLYQPDRTLLSALVTGATDRCPHVPGRTPAVPSS